MANFDKGCALLLFNVFLLMLMLLLMAGCDSWLQSLPRHLETAAQAATAGSDKQTLALDSKLGRPWQTARLACFAVAAPGCGSCCHK